MIALIQRVSQAEVSVDGEIIGRIGPGMLALIGVRKADGSTNVRRMVERILTYRIFPDREGRMNLSLQDVRGGLLLVPQFTLAADTRKGTRAGFSTAALPERAEQLFVELVSLSRENHDAVQTGRFGADMSVSLVNQGPVTFWLDA